MTALAQAIKIATRNVSSTINAIYDPLEQFEVFSLISLSDSVLLNNLMVTWGVAIFVLVRFLIACIKARNVLYVYIVNTLCTLVKSIVEENLNIKKQQYFTVILYLFFTILITNLIGLVPFAFTVTSSFGVTFFIALTHFIGVNLIGTTRHRWQARNLFLPAGVPLAITPFLILIEAVSYIARVLSLSIRLFANRRSGHALLKILIGFALTRASSTNLLLNLVSVIPWSIVTAVMFLELLIAFLQAYVFAILVTLYVNDVLTLH